jgi:hypothetical protein
MVTRKARSEEDRAPSGKRPVQELTAIQGNVAAWNRPCARRGARVRADSLLVVNRQTGLWKVKNEALRAL